MNERKRQSYLELLLVPALVGVHLQRLAAIGALYLLAAGVALHSQDIVEGHVATEGALHLLLRVVRLHAAAAATISTGFRAGY